MNEQIITTKTTPLTVCVLCWMMVQGMLNMYPPSKTLPPGTWLQIIWGLVAKHSYQQNVAAVKCCMQYNAHSEMSRSKIPAVKYNMNFTFMHRIYLTPLDIFTW